MVPRFDRRQIMPRLPVALRRLAWRAGDRMRRIWWRIARPRLRGCAVALFRDDGAVLLVRHGYGQGRWSLPGGGLGRHEDPLHGAQRECREETGLAPAELHFVDIFDGAISGATNRVHLFTGRIAGTPQVDGAEIVEADYFALASLPDNIGTRAGPWIARASAFYNRSS